MTAQFEGRAVLSARNVFRAATFLGLGIAGGAALVACSDSNDSGQSQRTNSWCAIGTSLLTAEPATRHPSTPSPHTLESPIVAPRQ